MINVKLKILNEQDIISKESFDYIYQVINYLKDNSLIDKVSDAEVLLTHLAMVCSRNEKNCDVISKLDVNICNQLRNNLEYDKSVLVWNEIKKMYTLEINSNEDDYMIMHILTLLNK